MRLDRGQGVDEVDIIIEAPEWELALPDVLGVVERAAAAALQATTPAEGHWQTAILLGYDATLRDLNRRFRGQDKPTNVLSFEDGTPQRLGDIALSLQTLKAEAREQGKTLKAHFQHLVAHGTLHLLGFDHEKSAQAERMEELERRILAGLRVADPYGEIPVKTGKKSN